MALSRLAQQFADEIRQHDWSDAPYRADRAGHNREHDSRGKQNLIPRLKSDETATVRMNVTWVAAQVLAYNDPNFDVYEFAEACGVSTRTRSGRQDGGIPAGLRRTGDGRYARPGTWDFDPEPVADAVEGSA